VIFLKIHTILIVAANDNKNGKRVLIFRANIAPIIPDIGSTIALNWP